MPQSDQFASANEAMHEGSRFTATEIQYAAEYLAAKGLIEGPEVAEIRGPVAAEITSDGMDCVVDWGGDLSAYLRRQYGSGSTSTTFHGPVFHGRVDGALLAWNNQTVTQIRNETQQVTPGSRRSRKPWRTRFGNCPPWA